MPRDDAIPDWVDRRTAEWCADLCDAVATRLQSIDERPHAVGAEIAGRMIRNVIAAGRPQLPAIIETVRDA